MQLRIRDEQGFIDQDFGRWIIPIIQTKLAKNINKYNLTNWTNYLNKSENISRLYTNKSYSAENIVLLASQSLVCKGTSGDISISFDSTKFVSGYDRLRLTTIIKTINYGTVDIRGCPIFTNTFNEIVEDIDSYVQLYYMM